MRERVVQFFSYYTGPFKDKTSAASQEMKKAMNKKPSEVEYFDYLRFRYEEYGEDPRLFVLRTCEEVKHLIKPQFKKLVAELTPILPILIPKYTINPQFRGFLVWYVPNKYEPYLRTLEPKIIWTLKTYLNSKDCSISGEIEYPPSFYPKVTEEDIIRYCRERAEKIKETEARLKNEKLYPLLHNNKENEIPHNYYFKASIETFRKIYNKLNGIYFESSYEVFQGIFGKSQDLGPVIWLKSATLMVFFIKQLQQFKLLVKVQEQDWIQLTQMFIKPDGSKFSVRSLNSLNQVVKLDGLNGPQQDLFDKIKGLV